ncbi:hypothetical protein EI42_06404 [Thermosporothrix hazakensis]|jgi:hypothetical protein|uniref:Uncharacterized protein n=1 Tax=Thermosporothrix hazakensis TaxID=644383 RepID=A0A326TQC9_THEHA|nr:hypothetical protein [Thermosporothrix hazakensis]PZW18034.1 hypothetical protein EI42_06404 [Thermosporothrix hazakensis]GCE50643.1 hypothetical protein KTH_55120 [Thermosporothrix hazakensis]
MTELHKVQEELQRISHLYREAQEEFRRLYRKAWDTATEAAAEIGIDEAYENISYVDELQKLGEILGIPPFCWGCGCFEDEIEGGHEPECPMGPDPTPVPPEVLFGAKKR